MKLRPVHTYVKMVQCPRCRYYFMPESDPLCWHCEHEVNPDLPPGDAAGAPAAWRESEHARIAEEIETGSPGALAGLGFAPPVPAEDRPGEAPEDEWLSAGKALLVAAALLATLSLIGSLIQSR